MATIVEDVHYFVSDVPPLLPPGAELVKYTREMKKRRKLKQAEKTAGNGSETKPDEITEKPAVPKHIIERRPKTSVNKNFIHENVEKIKNIKHKPDTARITDYCTGHQHYFEYEIDIRKRMNSGKYGKPPKYLKRMAKKMEKEQDNYLSLTDNTPKEEENIPKVEQIPKEIKESLLQELRKKHDELQREFLCLPFLIDTPPKVKRAIRLEKSLKQLEKDIDILERHAEIYIVQ